MLFSVLSTSVLANDTRPHEDPDENVEYTNMLGLATNKFEFNAQQFLHIYSLNSSTPSTSEYLNNKVLKYRQNLNDGTLVPINTYSGTENPATETAELLESSVTWNDGVINASDASMLLAISVHHPVTTQEDKDENLNNWSYFINMLKYSLADELDIDRDDVVVTVNVAMKAIPEYGIEANSYSVNTTDLFSNAIYEKMNEIVSANETINEELGISHSNWVHHLISVSATTRENGDWKLVLGTDNNFYFLKEETTEPIGNVGEFDTDLKYSVSVTDAEGILKNGTFIPPYIDNDIDKKDSDVTATISSKTNEGISVTNDVIVKTDRTANTEGWYYSSEDNIKSIDKKYLFDDYDNTTYNGIVSETVKIVGNEDGRDTQNVSIKWKFRRKSVKEKENDDKSVTITIEYNLPVDKDSIPDGWTPVYDADGKTVHAIKTTIKKGEDYDKDVIVKQNGTDEKVTTKVTKTWEKEGPSVLPQTGAFTVVLSIAILGIVVFAVTRYRKLKK